MTETKNMTFTNKQWWRFQQGWKMAIPIFDVAAKSAFMLTPLILMGVAVTVDMTMAMIGSLLWILWGIGFYYDRSGKMLDWASTGERMSRGEVVVHDSRLKGAITAQLIGEMMELDTSGADRMIQEEIHWFTGGKIK